MKMLSNAICMVSAVYNFDLSDVFLVFFYKQFLSIEKGALKGQNKQNYKCQNLLIRKYVLDS